MIKSHTDCYSLLEKLQQSFSTEALQTNFHLLCNHFLIEHFALVTLSNKVSMEDNKFTAIGSYPNGWENHYKESKYYLNDPVFNISPTIFEPFMWQNNGTKKLSSVQNRMMIEAYDHGIRSGTTIHMPFSIEEKNFFTILNQFKLHPEVFYVLTQAIQVYLQRQKELKIQEKMSLTPREWQIIQLKSVGMKITSIAETLKISEATVLFHISNVKRKMEETSLERILFRFGISTRLLL